MNTHPVVPASLPAVLVPVAGILAGLGLLDEGDKRWPIPLKARASRPDKN